MFQNALSSKDYRNILKIFNEKSIIKSVGHFFGLSNDEYCEFIIRHLHTENEEDIMNAISAYIPCEIPR